MKKTLFSVLLLTLSLAVFGAVPNNQEILLNTDFPEGKTFKTTDAGLASMADGMWYCTENPMENGMEVTLPSTDEPSLVCLLLQTPKNPYTNFLTQMTPSATPLQSGIYKLKLKAAVLGASQSVPFYLKLSSKSTLGTECSLRVKNGDKIDQASGKFGKIRINPVVDNENGIPVECSAEIELDLSGTESQIRVYFAFSDYPSSSVINPAEGIMFFIKDISLQRIADLPAPVVVESYYVRPKGNTTYWASQAAEKPEQVLTIANVTELLDYPAPTSKKYYFAQGTYISVNTVLDNATELYGGFRGDETAIDLNARERMDIDANGLVEKWEMKYPTIFTGDPAENYVNATGARTMVVKGNSILDGVTFNKYKQTYGKATGVITIGTIRTWSEGTSRGKFAPAGAEASKGYLRNCIVDGLNNGNGPGVIAITCGSEVDNCLLQNDTTNVGNGGGAIYMNATGGIVKNSVIRNNICGPTNGNRGGGVWAEIPNDTWNSYEFIVQNCLIANNKAMYGSAIRVDPEAASGTNATTTKGLQIVNCTFINGNATAANTDHIIESFFAELKVVNSILFNSTSGQGPLRAPGTPAATISVLNSILKNESYVNGEKLGNVTSGSTDVTSYKFVRPFVAANVNEAANLARINSRYNELLAANYCIGDDASLAFTTPGLTSVKSFSSVQSELVPTTDIYGTARTGSITIGAYQRQTTPTVIVNPKADIPTVKIYPSVATDEINIDGEDMANVKVILVASGTEVISTQLTSSRTLSVGQLAAGYYLVQVTSAEGTTIGSFIKK